MATLTIDGVVRSFSEVRVVDDVSISVGDGEFFTLLGPSGCGKTTLLRSMNRMNDLIPGAEVAGKITYHGQDLFASGLVSSMFAMQLVVHLESAYGIAIIGPELKLDNFRTVQAMANLVLRLRTSADG